MVQLHDLFAALADPTRLRILALVRTMELAVGELALILGQSQPRVSRHIRILADAALVERTREGSWVFLRLATPPRLPLLADPVARWPLAAEERGLIEADHHRLAAVHAERSAAADRYFADHAAEWDTLRSRHASDAAVEAAIIDLLGPDSLGHLVDIGTGTGRIAEVLAPAATRVSAIDRNPEMLRLARSRLAPLGLPPHCLPLALVQGDFTALPPQIADADTAVMHQVLHYAANPGAVIAEAARVLRPGGRLLIVDFAPHQDDDLRRLAAHVRLGFADGQMRGWFAAGGLVPGKVATLAGERLTVKLWLAARPGAAWKHPAAAPNTQTPILMKGVV